MDSLTHLVPGPPRATRPPPTVFCYICGRQFGSTSIEIHHPQCLKKWNAENDKLPKSKRRPPPVKPDLVKNDGTVDAMASNEVAWAASQALRVSCENCGRAFNADRLPVHQRSCTKENPAKRVQGK